MARRKKPASAAQRRQRERFKRCAKKCARSRTGRANRNRCMKSCLRK